eukprot:Rhum_TRINITY_DN7740_c0_g1::Rhum_TRINITY_DN7740_c0_g1_i1::g.24371::m.24371
MGVWGVRWVRMARCSPLAFFLFRSVIRYPFFFYYFFFLAPSFFLLLRRGSRFLQRSDFVADSPACGLCRLDLTQPQPVLQTARDTRVREGVAPPQQNHVAFRQRRHEQQRRQRQRVSKTQQDHIDRRQLVVRLVMSHPLSLLQLRVLVLLRQPPHRRRQLRPLAKPPDRPPPHDEQQKRTDAEHGRGARPHLQGACVVALVKRTGAVEGLSEGNGACGDRDHRRQEEPSEVPRNLPRCRGAPRPPVEEGEHDADDADGQPHLHEGVRHAAGVALCAPGVLLVADDVDRVALERRDAVQLRRRHLVLPLVALDRQTLADGEHAAEAAQLPKVALAQVLLRQVLEAAAHNVADLRLLLPPEHVPDDCRHCGAVSQKKAPRLPFFPPEGFQ